MPHTGPDSGYKEPKRFHVGTNSFGITAEDAAETMIRAEEIKLNKALMKEVKTVLKDKKKAIDKI